MFDFSEAYMDSLVIHQVGNRIKEEPLALSDDLASVSENELNNLLHRFFLEGFREKDLYAFHHDVNLRYNEINEYVSMLFDDHSSFLEASRNIAKKLYDVSTHPNVRRGELYVVFFSKVKYDKMLCDAMGIFKSETKQPYLKILSSDSKIMPGWDVGINPSKLDKGCIIFNVERSSGYRAIAIDAKSGDDTKYWFDNFLGIQKINSEYVKTKLWRKHAPNTQKEMHRVPVLTKL